VKQRKLSLEFGICDLEFKLANCQLPTANCQLPTANCQLPTGERMELKRIAWINSHICFLYANTIKKLVQADFSLYD